MPEFNQDYDKEKVLQKIEDAYNGENGYLNGEYLIKPSSESENGFTARKKLASWDDAFKMCVDSNVNPLFATQPDRETMPSTDYVNAFLADCDNAGTTYELFIETLALDLKLFGSMLVVMDNFTELSSSQSENILNRILPYIYTIRPDKIKYIKKDKFGRLESVGFEEVYYDKDGTELKGIRYFSKDETILYASDGEEVISKAPLAIGRIPCFLAYASRSTIKKRTISPSPILSWWQTSDTTYQMFSEIRILQRKFSFAQLAMQGVLNNSDDRPTIDDCILMYDTEAKNAPQWIQPSVEALNSLEDSRQQQISNLFRMAGLDYRFSGSGESGLAKKMAWEFAKLSFEALSDSMVRIEKEIIKLFGVWVGETYDEYTPIYSRSLGVDDTEERIVNASKIDSFAGDVPEVKEIITVESIRAYKKDLTDEQLKQIGDSANALATQQNIDASQSLPTPPQPE